MVDEYVSVQHFRDSLRQLLKIMSESISINDSRLRVRNIIRKLSDTVNITEIILPYRGVFRIISNSVSVTGDIVRFRGLGRIINNVIQSSESFYKRWSRSFSETVSISIHLQPRFEVIVIVIESISIQSFRYPIRSLIKVFTESVNIAESFVRNLQDGSVRVIRTLRIHGRNRIRKINNRVKSQRINDKDKSISTNDKDKNVKTYKRGKNIKGES